jgi:hypothetical protein
MFELLHQLTAGSGESISMKTLCLSLPKIEREKESWQLPNPGADRCRDRSSYLVRWISRDIYREFALEASC